MTILTELPRGVPSEYYIITLGYKEFYCDKEGIIQVMSENFDLGHPAYRSQWNIKKFDRERLTLTEVSVAEVARFVHEATKIYLKRIVDNFTSNKGGI